MYSTISFPKKNSGSDLVTHAWVVWNTINLVLSMFIDKPLSVQNSFKAFRYLCSPSGESEISPISTYSNICIAILARRAPEPPKTPKNEEPKNEPCYPLLQRKGHLFSALNAYLPYNTPTDIHFLHLIFYKLNRYDLALVNLLWYLYFYMFIFRFL